VLSPRRELLALVGEMSVRIQPPSMPSGGAPGPAVGLDRFDGHIAMRTLSDGFGNKVSLKLQTVVLSVKGAHVSSEPRSDGAELNPRTRRVRRIVLDAAIEVLLENGVSEVTASRVAERAEVARTTVYRQWPDQASLLLATIGALTAPHHSSSSTGDLRSDLTRDLMNLRNRLVIREVRPVFGALAAYSARDEAFSAAQRHFVEQLIQPVVNGLQAARQRGDLHSGLDQQFEATLLAGPILHQYLLAHADVTDDFIEQIVARWFAATAS
jgi:AcrR family transcriptional regulator